VDDKAVQPDEAVIAVRWFTAKSDHAITKINDHFEKFRISDALMCIYRLVWDDYCSWYLEIIKPGTGEGIDAKTYSQTIKILERLLRIMHPFMPFITEEIWHQISARSEDDYIVIANWPQASSYNNELLAGFELMSEVVTGIRSVRKNKNISYKQAVDLQIKENQKLNREFDCIISKLANVKEIKYVDKKPKDAQSLIIGLNEYFVPYEGDVDSEEEIAKLKAELDYSKGFKDAVMKKLNNENFVSNAPEKVVALERMKLSDAESRIKVIEEQLKALSN
jgi:valyl-tRNA synthetase